MDAATSGGVLLTMAPRPRASLFVNAKSRRGGDLFEQAVVELKSRGVELVEAERFKNGSRMNRAIRLAKDRADPLILVGGGDGTLHQAAGILAQSNSVLGVLPLGTGNAFARDLGIETDVVEACRIAVEGRDVDVDLGILNGTPFLSVATLGLSTLIARNLNPIAKRRLGPLAYVRPFLTGLLTVRPFRVEMKLGGRAESFESIQVVIGNGRYHAGPFALPGDSHLQSGQLVAYALATSRRSAVVRYMLALARGTVSDLPEAKVFHFTEGEIACFPPKRIVVDGEPLGRTPATLSVGPGMLRVRAPQEIPGDD